MPLNPEKISLTDEELVAKIVAKNDTHYFSILYDRYSDKVYGKCLSFVKSTDEAQDLAHDIFVNLFVKLRTFKGKSSFSTWLYAFTYNFSVNYVNRKRKKAKEKFTELKDENFSVEDEISDNDIFEMKVEKLQLALEKIEPNDKAILLMKYLDDFSIADIQAVLELGESAVKMRLKRAKQKLVETYNNLSNDAKSI